MVNDQALIHATGVLAVTFLFVIGFAISWLIALIDVMRSDFKSAGNKVSWLLMLLFIAPIGVILYALIGRSQKVRR